MQLVETVLGNLQEAEWKTRLATASIDWLELSQWDAQKNRLRKNTQHGLTVAVSLDRNAFLHDGDVLLWDESTQQAVVCKIDLCEVLVIELAGMWNLPPGVLIERCVQLGHALGNQHWPAVVKDGLVYVPMAVNRLVMNSVMNTHHFAEITYHFVPGAEVAALLEPAQARRLFGGTERPMNNEHGHGHGADHHAHAHPDDHPHDHEHKHPHDHKHDHPHEHQHA